MQHEQNRTINQIAEKADLTKKDSEEKALNAFIETVTEALKACSGLIKL
ncbi:HU family DNA-binding protein [Arsenophonus sp.]